MKPLVTMRAALADPALFAPLLGGDSWRAWRVLLIAAMGESLDDDERVIFNRLTGREREPLERVESLVAVVGRRGGKSRSTAVLAAFLSALCDHSGAVVPGEKPLVLCLAQNSKQASIVFSYVVACFDSIPALAEMIENRTADTLVLSNGVNIEVRAASFRGLRGVTALAVLADETCFWFNDEASKNADSEILAAVRPSLATTGGPLIMISSPYAKRGETWELYRRHYGPNGDPLILVAQGASRDFNPSLPQRVVDRALEADPEAAAAEYLGMWRSDLENFISREVVESCVARGRFELPRRAGVRYIAFVDPSGGSNDEMTLAIVHREGDATVLDCVRAARPPFSPEAVVAEFSQTLRSYGVLRVQGDKYGGEWPRERFRVHGISYEPSAKPKSDIYRELLPMLNAGRVELLDHGKLVSQLSSLERRTSRGGRDSIDHPVGGHDDVINSVAGAIIAAASERRAARFVPAFHMAR